MKNPTIRLASNNLEPPSASSVSDHVENLQARFRLSTETNKIIANRDDIATVRELVKGQLALVEALYKANQAMCKHGKRSSLGDGDWSCDWCGCTNYS